MARATIGDAIYARYSSELQNPRSCDDQITELRQVLERRGGRFDDGLVFRDTEVSGGVWHRSGLQSLLRAVESGRIQRIFVEDLSRLSRDKEDAARIEKLFAFSGVSVVTLDGAVYDGSAGSSLAYTFLSAGNAQYLKDLGAKTRRGLRGAHREGKSTGGRCFGFRARGGKIEVDEAEAAIVRRMFGMYLGGDGYATIAQRLTAQGIAPPRSKRRAGDGWVHTCVREMLRNPKYIGEFSFGRRKWQRHPTSRKRVARVNDDADVLREERPDLAIVDRATWDAVQVRLGEHSKNYKARAIPHQKTGYLLTGLLKCGCCGALMQISGGSPHRYYRCVSNRKRGACSNRLSVRESLARERILDAIQLAVATPDAAAYVRHRLAERMGALSREAGAELVDRTSRLKRVEERVRSIILMQVDGDWSPMVAQMRADFESQAQAERLAVSDLQAQADAPIRLPPIELITERVLSLKALTESVDIDGARSTLRRYLKDGQITLTPELFGDVQAYTARAEFLPLVMLTDKAETPPRLLWEGVVHVLLRGGATRAVYRDIIGIRAAPGGMSARKRCAPRYPNRGHRPGEGRAESSSASSHETGWVSCFRSRMTGRCGWSRLVAMDALLAHDREHACELDPAEKLQQALDVMRAGIRLKRSTLRRQFAEADETEVDHRLAEWLRGDG